MRAKNTIEEEVNQIRLAIYEETKHMTPKERTEHDKERGELLAKKYGFKLVKNAN